MGFLFNKSRVIISSSSSSSIRRIDMNFLRKLIAVGSTTTATAQQTASVSMTHQLANTPCQRKLFTPGPCMTTLSVKQAMLRDIGAGEAEFKETVQFCRTKLLDIAGVSNTNDFVAVIMQGSGTYGIESVIEATTNETSNFLIIENGLYGKRIAQICEKLNIAYHMESFEENRAINVERIESYLKENANRYSNVGIIHSETSSGTLNPVHEIGCLVKKYLPDATYIVDSMCCFGAIETHMAESNIHFLISSANKCIQAVPGISFIICNKEKLLKCRNFSATLSLDLLDQYEFDLKHKLFRFTPPTHVVLAFKQALIELEADGGPRERYKRIQSNHTIIHDEMHKLGFSDFVPIEEQSKIINSFYYPKHANFVFEKFHELLLKRGKIIYSKNLTKTPTFRIGNIGDIHSKDMYDLVDAIKDVLKEMNVPIPVD